MLEARNNHAYKPRQSNVLTPRLRGGADVRASKGLRGIETLMRIVKSLVLAGLLAFAPAAVVSGNALAQDNAAAPAAAAPAVADNAVAPAESTTAATPAAKVAAPARMQPTEGIGMPRPAEYTLQEQFTQTGRQGRWLHDIMLLPIITVISIFVLILLAWVIFRYRRSANPVPSKTSHNTLIEVLWTVLPVVILLAIAVPSIGLLADQYRPAPKDALTVKVTGYQWYWGYEYPDAGIPEFVSNMLPSEKAAENGEPALLAVDNRLVLPAGRPVRLIITAADVIHSFAVPSLWVKMDAVPGRLNEKSFTIEKPGVYYGQCSELCGARHAFMPIAVEALPPEQFDQWVLSQGGTLPGAKAAPAAEPAPQPGSALPGPPTDAPSKS